MIRTLILFALTAAASWGQFGSTGTRSTRPGWTDDGTTVQSVPNRNVKINGNLSVGTTALIDSGNYSTFAAACSAAVSANATLMVSKSWTGLTTQTCGANLRFYLATGAAIDAASGQTVTLEVVDAPLTKIFGLTGTIRIRKAPEIYPEWWGAVNDGVTDCAPAINAAINASPGNGTVVKLHNGSYGLNSPIFVSRIGTVLDGESPVYTLIEPLKTDISVSGGSNALIVNKVQPTNARIRNIRFSEGGINFAGWGISAATGQPNGEVNFTSIYIDQCWIAFSAPAYQGFFRGGFVNGYFTNNQFEFARGTAFSITTAAVEGFWSNNNLSQDTYGRFIDTLASAASNNTHNVVNGLTADNLRSDFLIALGGGGNWTISNVVVTGNAYIPGGSTYAPGLFSFTNQGVVNVSNFTYSGAAANNRGIEINNSEVNLSNGNMDVTAGMKYLSYPFYLTGAGNKVSVDGLTLRGGGYGQIATSNAGGYLRVARANFDRSPATIIRSLGTETIDVDITNSTLINANYNGARLWNAFDYATSGRFSLSNSIVGSNDALSTPVAIFNFSGTGVLTLAANVVAGLGGGLKTNGGATQVATGVGFSAITVDGSASIGGGVPITYHSSFTGTWDPPSLASGGYAVSTIGVGSTQPGDVCNAALTSIGVHDVTLTCFVQASGMARVVLHNLEAGALDVGSGTLRVDVWRH